MDKLTCTIIAQIHQNGLERLRFNICQEPKLSKESSAPEHKENLGFLVSSGLEQLDELLGGDGYPPKSSILASGSPGVGKEALGYWFTRAGVLEGAPCIYVTRLGVSEVLAEMRAFHVVTERQPTWIAAEGSDLKCDVTDLTALSSTIKKVLAEYSGKDTRVVTDVLSPLLMLNPPDTIYRFLSQLLGVSKQNNAVFLATIEQGMHEPRVLAAMEQLFDGVLEMRLYEEGARIDPLFRIKKMRGLVPQPAYFRYEFSRNGEMEIKTYAR